MVHENQKLVIGTQNELWCEVPLMNRKFAATPCLHCETARPSVLTLIEAEGGPLPVCSL